MGIPEGSTGVYEAWPGTTSRWWDRDEGNYQGWQVTTRRLKHTCIFNLEIDFKIKKLPRTKGKWTNCSKESEEKQVGSTGIQDHSYSCLVNISLSNVEKMTDNWKQFPLQNGRKHSMDSCCYRGSVTQRFKSYNISST